MLKSWTTSLARLLLAASIGLGVWYGVYRLTTPQPHHACFEGLLEFPPHCSFFNFPEPKHYRFDSTGCWFAVGPSRYEGGFRPMVWQVYHLKTGKMQTLNWEDNSFDQHAWLPLETGYRHRRLTQDGGVEVVDTSFVDGNSTVRLNFSRDSVADSSILFSQDGNRAVTTHRLPLVKLLRLGSTPGFNFAEALLAIVEPTIPRLPVGFAGIGTPSNKDLEQVLPLDAAPRLMRSWKMPTGELEYTYLLPAFTDKQCLRMSPDGRWLMRLEPSRPKDVMFNGREVILETFVRTEYKPVEPRGLQLYDLESKAERLIQPREVYSARGYFDGVVTDAGMQLDYSRIYLDRYRPCGTSMLANANINEDHPMFLLPHGDQLDWDEKLVGKNYTNVLQ